MHGASQTLTPSLAESPGVPQDTTGVVISEVLPGSPAAAAGLTPGEVIVEIDRKPVAARPRTGRLAVRQHR